jgi:DNA-binding transcriptional MerR regulator
MMRVAGDPEFEGIPDKLYFKIGEVCELTGVKSHTLRYWETEFAVLRPQRAVSKQRLYRRVDVENILRIKKFIQEDGLTMAGVKKAGQAEARRQAEWAGGGRGPDSRAGAGGFGRAAGTRPGATGDAGRETRSARAGIALCRPPAKTPADS